MEPWAEDPPGALAPLAGACASRPDGTGSTTWHLAKLGSWGFCFPLEEKNELSFCRKMGVKVFHFHLFYIKNSQCSAVRMDSDTLWTVQGNVNIPVASWHLCCMCYHCCLGVQATVCQICSPVWVIIEAATTGDFPFGLDFLPFMLLSLLVFSWDYMYFYKLTFKFFNEHACQANIKLSLLVIWPVLKVCKLFYVTG